MPNLIYVSREKSRTSPHHFKAGALNVLVRFPLFDTKFIVLHMLLLLPFYIYIYISIHSIILFLLCVLKLRVSAAMTNAPIFLTLDCDMYSNDPHTPLRALCYLSDPKIPSKLGYIQFPQMFHGINKNDIYGCEYKRCFKTNLMGLDGLMGPIHIGSGCFFNRRVFFGGPSTFISPEISEISPYHVVDKPIQSQPIMELAHKVAGCNYEDNTKWGFKVSHIVCFLFLSLVLNRREYMLSNLVYFFLVNSFTFVQLFKV
jgi:hypothetical protein